METDQRYVFYKHLVFFWRKKWAFLIVPLIVTGVALLLNGLQERPYEGVSKIYVGDLNEPRFSNPDIVKAEYEKLVKLSDEMKLSVYVPKDNIMSFKLTGGNEDDIEEGLDKIVSTYYDNLMAQYQNRYSITSEYLETLTNKKHSLEKSIESGREKLINDSLSPSEKIRIYELLVNDEDNLLTYTKDAQKIRNDLAFFEKPKLINTSIGQRSSYIGPITAISLGFGIFLTVIILVLWKYILEAKENSNN